LKAEEAATSFENVGVWTIYLAAPGQQMPATLEISYWLSVHDRMSRAEVFEHTFVRLLNQAAVLAAENAQPYLNEELSYHAQLMISSSTSNAESALLSLFRRRLIAGG
jgi:hypothetical protein